MRLALGITLSMLLLAGFGCDKKAGPATPPPPAPAPTQPAAPAPSAGATKEKDPVCGMDVASDAKNSADYDGKTYHFCGPDCQKAFQADPKKYVK